MVLEGVSDEGEVPLALVGGLVGVGLAAGELPLLAPVGLAVGELEDVAGGWKFKATTGIPVVGSLSTVDNV